MVTKVELPAVICLRCGYVWTPRKSAGPKWCPECNSPYWNKPRMRNREKTQENERNKAP